MTTLQISQFLSFRFWPYLRLIDGEEKSCCTRGASPRPCAHGFSHFLLCAAPRIEAMLLESNRRSPHGIGSIKAVRVALTGDHYRTLEAIKLLELVINDSSPDPADLAQTERDEASRPFPNARIY
ncbi:hypothetical protein GOODEAATRI_015357 [Goodea atripinnis]|uniref:Uncharacterized protein n=1 Tax=Goodea atripinnis TaxID=208336 RepID=A0ABV0MKY6_9TELE